MIRLHSPLKNKCIEIFGEKDGVFLAEFYTDYFNTSHNKNGYTRNISNKEKIESIEFLVKTYSKEKLLACAHKFIDDEKQGMIKTHNYNYFVAAVKNFKIQGESKSNVNIVIESKVMTPVIYKKNDTNYGADGKEYEHLDYLYKCECGRIHDGWATKCPDCGIRYSWS